MLQFLQEIASRGRLFISGEPVPADELPTLTASAHIGLAGYRPGPDHWTHGDNFRYMGLSSGKISYYAMCGLPILTSAVPSLERLVKDHNLGRSYRLLADSGRLVQEILENRESLSNSSRRFYERQLSPETPVSDFCDKLLALNAKS